VHQPKRATQNNMAKYKWKSIVVAIVDPYREEQLALAKAAAIAERSGARVILFNAFALPAPPSGLSIVSSREVLQAAIDEHRQQLERLARPLEKNGLATTCVAEWDFPWHEAIVRFVLRTAPDLLIAESHRHNVFARMVFATTFLANTDWELIRSCPCPIWLARSRSLPKEPSVLVAVDPRHMHAKPARLDDRLIASAKRLVDQLGGTVSIAHVYEPLLSGASATFMEPIRLPLSSKRARDFDAATRQAVDALALRHAIKPAQRILETGDPVHTLPAIVKKLKTDVLVMGAVSRSRVARPFIGNTAEKVIDHVGCDVFIVKPANFKTAVKRSRVRI
jgi:universal stress protein E